MRTSAALPHARPGSRAASPVVSAPAQLGGVGLMDPPSTAKVLPRLRRRQRDKDGSGLPPRNVAQTAGTPRPPKCDKCHVAEAQYQVVLNAAHAHYLFLCGHHARKFWADLVSRGYNLIKL